MGDLWQNPYVNLFKHYGVGQWKKCNKEGEVTSQMDRVIKSPIYKITGTVPANNYIVIPKHSSQSVGLVGAYLYILFQPIPAQYFTLHLEVVTHCGVTIRISISNLYKQFKASATWLQFPFVIGEDVQQKEIRKWTVLMFNFPAVLRKYLNRNFSHVKSVKVCANILIKNIFTSSKSYNPHITEKKVKSINDITGPSDEPFTREMRYPVPSGHEWKEFYNFIRFPSNCENMSISLPNKSKGSNANHTINPSFVSSKNGERIFKNLPLVHNKGSEIIVQQNSSSKVNLHKSPPKKASEKIEEDFQNMSLIENVNISLCKEVKKRPAKTIPLCKLDKIIGFGPCKTVLFSNDNEHIFYTSGSVIIKQFIEGSDQHTFQGHNNTVVTFDINDTNEYLASSQAESPLVRIWKVASQECIAIVKSSDSPCRILKFSTFDKTLLGVCNTNPKSKIIVWDTSMLKLNGDIKIISEGISNDKLIKAELSPTSSSKIASCSSRSLQIWRLKTNKLKSCCISNFHGLEYVLKDIKWAKKPDTHDLLIYVATGSGVLIEVDPSKVTVSKVIDVLSENLGASKSINSLSVHDAFFVTGSDDGNMKVWDPSLKSVILNAEHESAVVHVSISVDGLKLLAVTETDSVGVLDATTKVYKTVLRSHSKKINGVAIDPCHRQIITISQDNTLRIWDLDNLAQIYEIYSTGETPTSVAYHPYKGTIVAGYSKGSVRVLQDGEMVEEYCTLTSAVTATTFLPNGEYLYVSDALGTLLMYTANKSQLIQLKCIKHIVAKGSHRAPHAVQASRDSRLIAFAGPSEHCVSVLDSVTLSCLLKLDVSTAVSSCLDSVVSVRFGTVVSRDLFACTTSGKVLRVDTASGVIVSEHQPYPNSPATLLICDKYILVAAHNKFKVGDYDTLSVTQKYVSYDEVNHMVFTPDLRHVISCGNMITIWSFGGRSLDKDVIRTLDPSCQDLAKKSVSFVTEELCIEEAAPRAPVLEAPRPSSLEPVQSDIRLEQTLDTSEEKTLDLSSFHVDPAPPPHKTRPNVGLVTEDNGKVNVVDSDLEKVSSISGSNSDADIPEALCPLNGRHPFKLTPESASPVSPRASTLPLSLRHITFDNPTSTLASKRYMAAADTCGIELVTLIGSDCNARANLVWRGTNLFYTLGNVIVVEDLKTSKQEHLIQHTETITCLTSSNTHLASCSGAHKLNPSQICVWDIETLEVLQTLSYHEYQIQCIEFTIDGSYLISIGNYAENALVLWDIGNFALHTVAKTENHVNAACCDPQNSTEFVTVGKHVQFWVLDHTQELSVATGSLPIQFTRSMGDEVDFTSATYTEDGMVYVGTNNGYVTLWDPRSTVCLLHWSASPNEIDVLCINTNTLISGGISKSLKLWKIESPEDGETTVLLEDEIEFDAGVVSCIMDEHMQLGIVGTVSGTLWYVNWEDKTSIRLVGGHPDVVNDVATSTDNSFATACQDGSLRIWNFDPLEQALQFQVLNAGCTCVMFKPDDMARVSAGYSDGTIRTFDLTTVSLCCKMVPHTQSITQIKYVPTGQVLICGDNRGLVSVINAETGLIMRVISDHKNADAGITTLDFSTLTPHWMVTTADRRVSVWVANWDIDDIKMIDWLSFPAPAYTPDGAELTANKYSSLPPSLARFSPLEKHIIVYTGYGMYQELLFYNIKTKCTVRKMDLVHWATSLEIIPNSNLIVIGSNDRLVKILDYTSGTFQDYVAHPDSVGLCRFWEGRNVLFTGAGTSLALWNVRV